MCDICVTSSVKERMLSRRSFFAGVAATTAAATVATSSAAPASASPGFSGVVDMTHTIGPDFPTYLGTPQISMEQKFNYKEHYFNLFEYTVNEHTGTHIDAPLHFSEDGLSVDELPVEELVAPLCVIDIAGKAAKNADAQVTPDDIKTWMGTNGDFPENSCVAMNSGWSARLGSDKF